ncbi:MULTISPECIES: RsmB/NOP family class I SAM-dependent RNA methyltransferase [Desulfovibrio]
MPPMQKTAARSFRIVCKNTHTASVEALLRAQGYEFEAEPFSPLCRRLVAEPRPLGSSLAAFFGYIYIQDRSSMLPPLALAPAAGSAVLDMCASPGSKTGFLAQLVGRTGFVLGNEPSPSRLATLRANLHQCGFIHTGTCSYSGDALPLRPGSWKNILLDPPCSGWGTVEKNPQVLKLWQGDKLDSLTSLQRRLLRHAERLLAPGGHVVFSTCTTNVAENEDQVRFAEEHLGLVREHINPFPGFVWEELPGGEGTLRVDGARSQAQGFYVALLRKPENASSHHREPKAEQATHFGPARGSDGETAGAFLNGGRARSKNGSRPDARTGSRVPAGTPLPRSCLHGPTCDPDMLPPGQAMLYGEHVRFIPEQAAALLPPDCAWQGALLGKFNGGKLDAAPRLRALMTPQPDREKSLVLEDISDISALLSGQSRQTGLQGREAALWWRDLPLGRVGLKQGRALTGFK